MGSLRRAAQSDEGLSDGELESEGSDVEASPDRVGKALLARDKNERASPSPTAPPRRWLGLGAAALLLFMLLAFTSGSGAPAEGPGADSAASEGLAKSSVSRSSSGGTPHAGQHTASWNIDVDVDVEPGYEAEVPAALKEKIAKKQKQSGGASDGPPASVGDHKQIDAGHQDGDADLHNNHDDDGDDGGGVGDVGQKPDAEKGASISAPPPPPPPPPTVKQVPPADGTPTSPGPLTLSKPLLVMFPTLRWLGQDLVAQLTEQQCFAKDACRALCHLADPDYLYTTKVETFNEARERTLAELATIATDRVALGSHFGKRCAHNSTSAAYPPKEVAFHSRNHPDLLEIVRAATEAGVEVRFVVPMPRDLNKIARQWLANIPASLKTMSLLRVLDAQLDAIYGQLVQIDRKHWRLFDLDALRLVGPSSLEDFTGIPGADAFVKEHSGTIFNKDAAAPSAAVQRFIDDMAPVFQALWRIGDPDTVEPQHIHKKVVRSSEMPKSTVAFFAGLEGTGHHLWRSVVDKMAAAKELEQSCKVQTSLYDQKKKGNLWHSMDAMSYTSGADNLGRAFKEIASKPSKKVILGNILTKGFCGTKPGMMSYPNFSGPNKNIQRPNLVPLARIAEENDVDLRVILLFRDVQAMITSTVDHRHFAQEGAEVRMLESNAYAMLAQLAAIGKEFVVTCFDFDDHEYSFLPPLEEYFGGPAVSEMFHQIALNTTHSSRKPSPNMAKRRMYLESLRATNEFIKANFC